AKAPLYLANILEHNYYVAKDNNEKELGGVVIGLAMNSVHYYEEQHGYPREVQISDEVLLKQGKEMAQKILP
ncbi:CamS family sex pheromone protein, partial [Streptococcus sobrinus]